MAILGPRMMDKTRCFSPSSPFERVYPLLLLYLAVPNLAARVLKGQRSKTIGLIVPSIADPFFASCAEVAGSLRPSVTVVQQPVEEIGKMAAKLLFERLAQRAGEPVSAKHPTRIVRLQSRLVIRASCGCGESESIGVLPKFRLDAKRAIDLGPSP